MYPSLHNRVLDLLADEGPLSAEDVTHRLRHKRPQAVSTAVHTLLIQGQVQRVRTSNRFRLSPTQAAAHANML